MIKVIRVLPDRVSTFQAEVTVDWLQSEVDGFFEVVITEHGSFYMNEEARGPINRVMDFAFNYRIHGPVIVCGPPDADGNDTDVLEATEQRIEAAKNALRI